MRSDVQQGMQQQSHKPAGARLEDAGEHVAAMTDVRGSRRSSMQTTQEVKMTIIRAALKMRVLRAVSLRHDVSMVRPTDEQGANHDSDVNAEEQSDVQVLPCGCSVQLP